MSSNRFCFYHCVPTSGGFAVSIHRDPVDHLFLLQVCVNSLSLLLPITMMFFFCKRHRFCTTGELRGVDSFRQSKFHVVLTLDLCVLLLAGSASAVQAAAKNQEIGFVAV